MKSKNKWKATFAMKVLNERRSVKPIGVTAPRGGYIPRTMYPVIIPIIT